MGALSFTPPLVPTIVTLSSLYSALGDGSLHVVDVGCDLGIALGTLEVDASLLRVLLVARLLPFG